MSLKKNLDIIIYEKLCDEILRGEWVQGQAINPDDFAKSFGVSRTPVLQALKRMNANNMIDVTRTGHFFVPTFTEKQVCDILEMRALLEREAVTEIENNGIALDYESMQLLAEKCLSYNESGEIVKARQFDLNFHEFLVNQTTNQCLCDIFLKVQGQFTVANFLLATHTNEQQKIAAEDHLKLLAALEARKYNEARQINDEHIFGARDKIIRKMRYSVR